MLCVPHSSVPLSIAARAQVVVIPTDFSALADRAISIGYSLLDGGGLVHLVHVMHERGGHDHAVLRAQLKARIPRDADRRGIRTELTLLEGGAAWLAIWQHAGRANADLICMSTHSKDALKSLVLGSQAQAILQHSRIPVVLVPPDRES